MITFEQRLLRVMESIRDELHGIREALENYHGDKSEEESENETD